MLKRSCPREGLRVFTSSEFEKFGDTSTTNLVSFVQSVELRNCRNFGTDISDIYMRRDRKMSHVKLQEIVMRYGG